MRAMSNINNVRCFFAGSVARAAWCSELAADFYAGSMAPNDEHKRDAQSRHDKNETGKG
jgi:hypothetical protein